MTVLAWVATALGAVAAVLSGLRWLRVAQREHYLSGSATRFALRWWSLDPRNAVLVVVAAAALALSPVLVPAGLVTVVICAVAPIGLGLKGRTSALVWTSRLRRVAAATAGSNLVLVAIGAVLWRDRGAMVASLVCGLFMPVIVDAALALLKPIEDRGARTFVRQAARQVERVRPRIVAITGSYGKTSTKGYVAHLASGRMSVLASPRSYNNQSGLARTVNELLVPGTEVLVAEMGTYGKGEIAAMVSWLPPEISMITAIGPVHLERFGSMDVTLEAKSEILAGARVVVLNVDDRRLASLAERLKSEGREVHGASAIDPSATVAVIGAAERVALYYGGQLVGEADLGEGRRSFALSNVACAVAAAVALGVPVEEVLGRLGGLPVAANRLERALGANGATILDDTYNSNPAGARLALEALAAARQSGRRAMVVTPGMIELGPEQASANEEFAREVGEVASDLVIVGRTNRRALRAGASSTRGLRVHECPNRDAAVALVRAELGPGDVVLYENDLPDHYA